MTLGVTFHCDLTAKLYLQVGPSVTGSRGRADAETLGSVPRIRTHRGLDRRQHGRPTHSQGVTARRRLAEQRRPHQRRRPAIRLRDLRDLPRQMSRSGLSTVGRRWRAGLDSQGQLS
jgi:hypothetical protein